MENIKDEQNNSRPKRFVDEKSRRNVSYNNSTHQIIAAIRIINANEKVKICI